MRVLALLPALCCLVAAAPAHAGVTGPEIVGHLNAQRAAHGLPAGIAEDAALSDGCTKHNAYGRLNDVLTHGEDPSKPGYTPEGDQAGKTSVLYRGGVSWTAERNPFETAPIHLHQLLAPRIDRMGASEDDGFGCATTLASRNRPAPPADVTYTYPGDGATGWPASQIAAEGPYTPGERVGIPAGTETGPYLYVMFDGPDLTPFDTARATAASLTGPDGAVEAVSVDNATPGLEGFLPTGMELIPRRPLRPRATYTASVSADVTTQDQTGPSRSFTRTWSFTTGQLGNAIHIDRLRTLDRHADVFAQSRAPGATVTATGPGTPATAPLGADGRAAFDLDADGTWRFCARSGGADADYEPAEDCLSATVTAPRTEQPPLVVKNPPVQVGEAPDELPAGRPFSVSVPKRVRRGRSIRFTVTAARRFRLAWRLSTVHGRTLVARGPRSRKAATWTFKVTPPRAYRRKGRRLRLRLTIEIDGRRSVVRRTVRYR
ncbi:MAG TPA: hypothetical protein VF533_20380 [Solirubrobacteraceae bacterium]